MNFEVNCLEFKLEKFITDIYGFFYLLLFIIICAVGYKSGLSAVLITVLHPFHNFGMVWNSCGIFNPAKTVRL